VANHKQCSGDGMKRRSEETFVAGGNITALPVQKIRGREKAQAAEISKLTEANLKLQLRLSP